MELDFFELVTRTRVIDGVSHYQQQPEQFRFLARASSSCLGHDIFSLCISLFLPMDVCTKRPFLRNSIRTDMMITESARIMAVMMANLMKYIKFLFLQR